MDTVPSLLFSQPVLLFAVLVQIQSFEVSPELGAQVSYELNRHRSITHHSSSISARAAVITVPMARVGFLWTKISAKKNACSGSIVCASCYRR